MTAAATSLLAYIPSPDRGVWYLGPIPLRAYALFIILGIVVAVVWGERRFVARGGQSGTVTDVAVFAVPFGLVGGRLYHVATDWQTYFGPGGDPIGALKIWQGGLGIWGAIALGAVGAWIGCRRRGVPLPFFADAVAPGIVVAQAIGRLGNYFNQELYGAPTTLPWGLEIYRRVDPATGVPDALGGIALDRTPIEIVQPTFLYELIWNLLVAALVVRADRRFRLGHGRAFAVYVAGYTAGRFVIEQMRSDYATRVFGDIRVNVVVAAVVCVGALLYLALVRGPREVLTGPAAAVDPDGAEVDQVPGEVGARRAKARAAAAGGTTGGSVATVVGEHEGTDPAGDGDATTPPADRSTTAPTATGSTGSSAGSARPAASAATGTGTADEAAPADETASADETAPAAGSATTGSLPRAATGSTAPADPGSDGPADPAPADPAGTGDAGTARRSTGEPGPGGASS